MVELVGSLLFSEHRVSFDQKKKKSSIIIKQCKFMTKKNNVSEIKTFITIAVDTSPFNRSHFQLHRAIVLCITISRDSVL